MVTPPQKPAILLGNLNRVSRFGTEGSEVQILSPRPFLRKITKIQSAGTLGSAFEITCRNRVIGASNLA